MYLLSDLTDTFKRELGLEASEAARAVESILKQMHSSTGTGIDIKTYSCGDTWICSCIDILI